MTDREKYLTILDRFYRGRGGSLLTKDESEALDYAISSIKTDLKYDLLYEETNHIANVSKKIESTPKNDLGVDAVSRKDVHDMLENLPITVGDKWFNWLQKACIRLAELPSVTPQEPKTGHWIWCVGSHKCSNCEEYTCFSHKELLRYCPNCGAKMVEPQESEV